VRVKTRDRLKKLAAADRRSMSDYLDILIEREFAKLPKDQQ
jgi:hypothetical protein